MKIISNSINRFINLETSSSILLFIVSIIAVLWANSSFGNFYEDFWNHQFTIGFANSDFHLAKPLILWINDGLMAIFFFVIGLEVKREILEGELTTLRKASLPIFAAIGGMLFPVLIFSGLNYGKIGAEGWGIPMATDIAFTLGILKLLGNRVPLGLKIFLTAFAIVDDIGAVLVIAIFYSANIQWDLIMYALLLVGVVGFLSYKQVYSKYFYFVIGFIVWLLFLKSGIHPTIAGILMAFTIPIQRKVDCMSYFKSVSSELNIFKENSSSSNTLMSKKQIEAVGNIETLTEEAYSPLQQLEHNLHGWVSYIIMPIFALANAGVVLSFDGLGDASHITLNIALALVLGNTIGIVLMSLIGIKLKLADLPEGVNYKQLLGVSLLGGLGFTMSLFIANLAFNDLTLIAAAKMGIIIGSLIAGVLGYLILRFSLKISVKKA
ncbi:Na+/H+ antiporter NhaA [Lutibacter sp.]|uniref:Na+/H+ antiporter NhaA n=1 Tax=Lutibacter sp. TaxID=1925666 RepID=UPI001A32F802|nr:Na+/H+ antiporter NhaA [Lutibacter sp.]MBI9042326.1 Na+/H+ antiporter NhaA [Lutibacter sp.]